MKLGDRIIVIGCSGSGKSTLSVKLAQLTRLPLIHLDKEYWIENWIETQRDEWHIKHDELLSGERWIMDGNFGGTLEKRVNRADTVVFLDMKTITCLIGVTKRVFTNYGKTRPDMADNCPERFDFSFMKWICGFKKKQRAQILDVLSHYGDKQIVTLHSHKEVEKWLEVLK